MEFCMEFQDPRDYHLWGYLLAPEGLGRNLHNNPSSFYPRWLSLLVFVLILGWILHRLSKAAPFFSAHSEGSRNRISDSRNISLTFFRIKWFMPFVHRNASPYAIWKNSNCFQSYFASQHGVSDIIEVGFMKKALKLSSTLALIRRSTKRRT